MLWHCLSVQRHRFLHDITKSFAAINFKFGIQLLHGPLRKPIHVGVMGLIFKVTVVTKVKFRFCTAPLIMPHFAMLLLMHVGWSVLTGFTVYAVPHVPHPAVV